MERLPRWFKRVESLLSFSINARRVVSRARSSPPTHTLLLPGRWFMESLAPQTQMQDVEIWTEMSESRELFVFDEISIFDRWRAHEHNEQAQLWNKVSETIHNTAISCSLSFLIFLPFLRRLWEVSCRSSRCETKSRRTLISCSLDATFRTL